jgi:anaphase-promoting complex subunit 3
MQSTRRSAHVPSPATPQRQSVLRQFILSSLIHSPPTALFFAERLYALDATLEPSVFLLALTLSNSGRHNEVIWLLRQPVSFPPLDPSGKSTDHQNHNNRGRTTFPTTRLPRPSIECSLRCARLYASCCLVLGRQKEGRDVLSKLTQSGSTLITPDAGSEPSSLPSLYHQGDTWILELEMARLSKKAGEVDRAIESYRKVLEANHYCWEALEGLCTLGLPPDPELLFPARPRPVPVAVSPIITHSKPPPPSLPLPLGPSQSSAVNSVVPSKARYGHQGTGKGEGLGFFTPSDSTVALGLPVTKAKAFGQGWTKMMAHNISELHDVSADER